MTNALDQPRIRPATDDDVAAITEILNQAIATRSAGFTQPVTDDERRTWLHAHGPNQPVVVAEINGQVTGWAHLSDYRLGRRAFRATAEISYYVHDECRRRGVASALVTDLIARCPGLGIETLVAFLLANNVASLSLLAKFGFEEWGRMPQVAVFAGEAVDHVYYGRRVSVLTDGS